MFFRQKDLQQDVQQEILLNRLQDEVNFLRQQNSQLLDRLLAITQKEAFQETKRYESIARQETIELEKYRGLTKEQIKEFVEKEKKDDEIVAIQMRQMMTGGE